MGVVGIALAFLLASPSGGRAAASCRPRRPTIVCLGDSNTSRPPPPADGWCERMAARLAERGVEARVLNRGVGGTRATVDDEVAFGFLPLSARRYVQRLVAGGDPFTILTPRAGDAPFGQMVLGSLRADLALLAWGTNDLRGGRDPWVTVGTLASHRAMLELAGIRTIVATIPPYETPDDAAAAALAVANRALRFVVPRAARVDFTRGFSAAHLHADGVHVNERGHEERARRAARAVRRLFRSWPPC